MENIPPDMFADPVTPRVEDLFPSIQNLFEENQMPNVVSYLETEELCPEQPEFNLIAEAKANQMDEAGLQGTNNLHDVATPSSLGPIQLSQGNADSPWVQENEQCLKQALGIDHNKPGPRPGHKKGMAFEKDLKAARGCPIKMAGVRKKHRHLFEGNCRRAMEQRIQMVFEQLLTCSDPSTAALDPMIDLDVQFANEYYDIDLVALATPP